MRRLALSYGCGIVYSTCSRDTILPRVDPIHSIIAMPAMPPEQTSFRRLATPSLVSALPRLTDALLSAGRCVFVAPPGAGKTTVVPLHLLDAPWLRSRRIVMLEPRRLAARAAARFMARLLGEQVGETVGYRMRLDSRVGPRTRMEVVTEGVLGRMLHDDPTLEEYGLVIFDEYHERSLQADLGLALCLDVADALRDDLRLLAMSATLDAAPLGSLMGGCPVIECEGRQWPVEVRYTPPVNRAGYPSGFEDNVAACVRRALAETEGNVLVFLPGGGEIRRTARRLEGLDAHGVGVHMLYGDLAPALQDAALAPDVSGARKVVLATALAETSLTIEGVRVVVDGGLARFSRFDPQSGMSRLVTERISLAGATQRAGRAGRTGPGVCYRLWHEGETASLRPFARPEVLDADLAPLMLQLSAWGVLDPSKLRWLDAPPEVNVNQARILLQSLGAIDASGRITGHGKSMNALPLHPRLAHMVLSACRSGSASLACVLACLLEQRGVAERTSGCDIRPSVEDAVRRMRHKPRGASREGWEVRLASSVDRIAALAGVRFDAGRALSDVARCGVLLGFAFPDRVAMNTGEGTFRLSCGRGAAVPADDALAREPFLVAAELDGDVTRARIWRAAPLAAEEVAMLAGDAITEQREVGWDDRQGVAVAHVERRFGALVLERRRIDDVDDTLLAHAVMRGIRTRGLRCLPWTQELRQWQARVELMRRHDTPGGQWPEVADTRLEAELEEWLIPFLSGIRRAEHFARIDLQSALKNLLSWEQARRLDAEAPTHVVVPSGSRVPLDYTAEGGPVLAVKLQELFGMAESPVVAGGVSVVVHLLSPAGRPLQVTRDLAGFWRTGYASVRAEMRGRYPKHPWPEDPLTAMATRHTRKRAGL